MSLSTDRETVRELAKRYREIAMSEKNVRMRQRFRDTNNLKIVRPPLIMEEIPWFEMNLDHELDCTCENPGLRGAEWGLRLALFRHKHFACDNYIEPFWNVTRSYSSTGDGLTIREQRLSTDSRNHIVSHHYEDVFEDESALELLHDPVITPNPEADRANLAWAEELVGDLIPVRLCGSMTYYSPWDRIAMARGVEPILTDLYERPEYLHAIIGKLTHAMESEIEQMKRYGLYGPESIGIHCTPAAVDYPEDGRIHTWFRTMAQMFSSISPEMHYEFDMAYSIPLAEQFSYTYYGCCEPLDDRIEQLMRFPNLRKVGCSPWASVERTAEQLGGRFVLSRKPNPANVAGTFDPDVIRKEIAETAEACLKYGCPCDITLKDISTVGYKPENLIQWSAVASEVLDEYYGEA